MRVGILTMHHSYNYGAALQAFALSEAVTEMGNDVSLIDLRGTYNKMYADESTQLVMKRRPPSIANIHRSQHRRKAELFNAFFDEYSSRSAPADPPANIDAIAEAFDTLIVGSDEVWTLKYGFNLNYFLSFGPENIGRISYAASFGRSTDVGDHSEEIKRALEQFDAISVRDHNSQRIVRSATGVMPPLVLDPVLLGKLGRISAREPRTTTPPTVLIYEEQQMSPSEVLATRRVARELGARIVAVGYPHWFADENVIAAGPLEVVQLVQESTLVVSSLFHGVVFGLAFEKQLLIMPAKKKRLKIESLLRQLGLTHLYGNLEWSRIEYDETRTRIEALRGVSLEFLETALRGIHERRVRESSLLG